MVEVHPCCRWFEIESKEEALVLRFTHPRLLDEEAVRAIRGRLFALLGVQGQPRFVLDFGRVTAVSSAMLANLIAFRQGIEQAGGEVTLCSLSTELLLKFEHTGLDRVFRICPGEGEALAATPDPAGDHARV